MSEVVDKVQKRFNREISGIYRQAKENLQEQLKSCLMQWNVKARMIEESLSKGEITKAESKRRKENLLSEIGMQRQAKKVANSLYSANQKANAIACSKLPEIIANGMNYEAWQAEMDLESDEGLYPLTEEELEQWMLEEPELFPIREVDQEKDTEWNKKNIMTSLLLGIALGIAFDRLPETVANIVSDRNHSSMISWAADLFFGSWEYGKDAMTSVEAEKGLEPQKEWLATLDFKTRDAHRVLDGQRVPADKPFEYEGDEIWFPRDPAAPAYLRCNCRCASRTIRSRYESKNRTRKENLWTYDDGEKQKKIIPYMTYQEWYDQKRIELGDDAIKEQIAIMKRKQRQKYYRKKKSEKRKQEKSA